MVFGGDMNKLGLLKVRSQETFFRHSLLCRSPERTKPLTFLVLFSYLEIITKSTKNLGISRSV